jgi:DNA-binding response OmpR family regulator
MKTEALRLSSASNDAADYGRLEEVRALLVRAQQLLDHIVGVAAPSTEGGQTGMPQQSPVPDQQGPVLEEAIRRAKVGDAYDYLGKQEMALLRVLTAAERPLSKAELLNALYPDQVKPHINIIAVYLCHLRKKLKPACGGKDPIQTIRGKGFKLHLDMLMGQPQDRLSVAGPYAGHS